MTQNTENKNRAVLGIYQNRRALEMAVDELKMAGYRNADISALLPTDESTKEFAHTKGTKAPEGASVGAASGALLGGALGWLIGIGSITIPGIGALVAAGPIVGSLAGVGVGGALGGLAGALVGMGVPEYEAKRYEGRVKEGGILLSVHCDNNDWERQAKEILKRTGAFDIAAVGESGSDSPSAVEKEKPLQMNQRY